MIFFQEKLNKYKFLKNKMELEPLPKVTFLPAQLTELVIKNWSGDKIDFERNGQVLLILIY